MTNTQQWLAGAGLFVLGVLVALGADHLVFKKADPRDGMATIASLQDWRLNCPPRTTKAGRCVMQSVITQPGTGNALAELTVVPKDKGDLLTVVAPLGVFVPPGVQVTVGGITKVLAYKTCVQMGCVASMPIDSGLSAALAKASGGQIAFIWGDGKTVPLNFSLKGYTDALADRAIDDAARK